MQQLKRNQSLGHFQMRIIISFNIKDISKKPAATCSNIKDRLVRASLLSTPILTNLKGGRNQK
jgi:hypothetical protein